MARDSAVLHQSLTRISMLEQNKATLNKKIDSLLEYCGQQEKFLQAKMLIIKLQQSKIDRLKRKEGQETQSEAVKYLEGIAE